jgi:hypothetical protein
MLTFLDKVQRRRRQSKKAYIIQCPTETPSIQESQHNTMSNGDTVNPRRPTQYNVKRRRRQSKKANTIQCLMETLSIQEGRLRWTLHCVGLLGLTASPLDIVLCWPSWIDSVSVGHCIVLAFLDLRRLRWTLYCVGLLGLTASPLDIVAVNPRRPTRYNVQRRRRQSKKANTIQCPTETPSIQEGQHNTMSNGDAGLLGLTASPLDIVLCWPSWIDGVCVGHCIVLAFLD